MTFEAGMLLKNRRVSKISPGRLDIRHGLRSLLRVMPPLRSSRIHSNTFEAGMSLKNIQVVARDFSVRSVPRDFAQAFKVKRLESLRGDALGHALPLIPSHFSTFEAGMLLKIQGGRTAPRSSVS